MTIVVIKGVEEGVGDLTDKGDAWGDMLKEHHPRETYTSRTVFGSMIGRGVILIGISSLLACVAPLFAGPALSQESEPFSVKSVVQTAKNAIVLVVASDSEGNELSQGSGFVIDASGTIVTNYHVMDGASTAVVKFYNGTFAPVEGVLSFDSDVDLVLLQTSSHDTQSVELGNPEAAEVGETVVVIGNPQGLEATVSEGIISAIRPGKGGRVIQFTAPVSAGSSGGAVLNTRGEVIGVTSFTVETGQNLNFAYPVENVYRLLADKKLRSLQSVFSDTRKGIVTEEVALEFEALDALNRRNYRLAKRKYEQILEADPYSTVGLIGVGTAMVLSEEFGEGAKVLRQGMLLDEIKDHPNYEQAARLMFGIAQLQLWQTSGQWDNRLRGIESLQLFLSNSRNSIFSDRQYRTWVAETLLTVSDVSGEWESNGIPPVSTWMRAPFTLELEQDGAKVEFVFKSPKPTGTRWTASIFGTAQRSGDKFVGTIRSFFSTLQVTPSISGSVNSFEGEVELELSDDFDTLIGTIHFNNNQRVINRKTQMYPPFTHKWVLRRRY